MLGPIALFVYNRPWHTRQTVEALQKNEFSAQSDLFIFSDAARKPEAVAAVCEVREYIKTIGGFKSVNIVERDRNLGLANSIIDGVSETCSKYGKVIVVEDDLIVSPHFLSYMNNALDLYAEEPRVMQISGHMFPIRFDGAYDAVFLPFVTSWGWATWGRAWACFDHSVKQFEVLNKDVQLRRRFNLDDAYPYFDMLVDQLNGRIDSWAIKWYVSVFFNDGLTLYPRLSLVINIGFDGSGTHGKRLIRHDESQLAAVISFPPPSIDQDARGLVFDYLRRQRSSGVGSLLYKARRFFE